MTDESRDLPDTEVAVDNPVESLIVLSDVHLGSDLVAHGPASALRRRSAQIDEELANLLDHYRRRPPERGRWRLVIAGDLIDFIGIVLPSESAEVETAPSEEERAHGLGNARDHALAKMRAVAERHGDVFDAMARFVADGNALTIIHGNHDLELYWDEVREELTRTLTVRARAYACAQGRSFDGDRFLERLDYSPWFFYRDGVAYIEHGHQYDAYCATHHLLAPLSPIDPRRVARGFCDVLLRFVVRQTPGLTEHGHEAMGIVDYLRFGWRLGTGGMVALALRFARAVRELFKLRRAYLEGATQSLRAQHERAMARFAQAREIGLGQLRALWRLQAAPITHSISGILGSLLLDRLALAGICFLLLGGFAISAYWQLEALGGALAVVPLWFVGRNLLARRRKIDAVTELSARAAAIAALFPAPFIVMGHTHVPARQAIAEHATYINVGSWAEDDGDHVRASRGHLVIHPGDDRPVAYFLRWDDLHGPRDLEPPT